MWKQLFKAVALAGTLDITAACIQFYMVRQQTPDVLLKYIASGLFGKKAFTGGAEYVLTGILVHFLIVFACAVIFFFLYQKINLLGKSIFLNALLIAVIAWAVTTRIIIPLSSIQPAPFNLQKAAIAVTILYCCVGLPIAFFAKQHFKRQDQYRPQ